MKDFKIVISRPLNAVSEKILQCALQGNVDFSPMEWKKSLKIGGNVLQLVVNAIEKEKLLNV